MNIHYAFELNFNTVFTGIVAWVVIGMIAYRIYKKQSMKPKVWKVFVIILVGLFSFSINWQLLGTPVKFSILPLGVLLLYWILIGKEGRWQRYRPYAWLGFFANYIFLAAILLSLLAQHKIYPENDLSTYISNTEDASIVNIHPSALDSSLDKESLRKQIHSMTHKPIHAQHRFKEEEMRDDGAIKRNERFPYQLTGTSAKWGSGLKTIIYLEADGKGMLVTSSKKQLYFRSKESLLKGGK
ncbi:hypothetical protein QNH20_01770 [Neobacillus sp. WH10]|uniref:hypothetical protein n=1 Tax=Neobacillus sp. WH10 TaxID=3047873 RepID=UPI0024C161D5|nr:hypothetical protein [Neobacillus sp. WH10]WHY77931.1 hypothetical protein QNH20_01770 [Neobacillus sp. WH10]